MGAYFTEIPNLLVERDCRTRRAENESPAERAENAESGLDVSRPLSPTAKRGGGRLRHGDRDADSRWFSGHEMEPPHPERAYGDARHRREAKY